ncbi:related to aspartate--tRNA ligase, mitochondrial [Ustilago trichophora]|uniref:Related to aspartate--tRNA ligase, mitochondrial n=1 Tax=Ustilago trichophora TaxID=86804 RepID=A0A5C3ERB2_9BASI|nr:related to aspartate--tRNA ligase, mitochondrial [Ustilago trichophora]
MLARNVRAIGRHALREHCASSSASLPRSCRFALVAPPHGGPQPRTRTYASTAASRQPGNSTQPSSSKPTKSGQSLAHDAFYGAFPSRTHICGELRPSHADQQVILTGWLQSSRQVSKQLGFLTILDHTGSVQLKVQPTADSPALLESFASIPLQSAVLIRGKVALRPSQDSNATQSTGAIEILPSSFTLLNPATRDLPFQPSDSVHADGVSAELRARYRYLDLRRPSLAENIRLRSRVTHAVRNHLYHQGFLEIETPVLLRSTPEGAREFLVPTRTSSTLAANTSSEPTFYALPQSPQQPKQLLIASGVTDKYFQIAKCFRDEDGRKDRQPEFTQIDLEMGFVSGGPKSDQAASQSATSPESKEVDSRDAQGQWRIGGHQVRDVIEALVSRIWQVAGRGELSTPFPVMSYWTAMSRYGSDKPDLRYDLALHDISSGFISSSDVSEPHVTETSLEILPYLHSSTGSLSKKELDTLLQPFKGKVERFRIASPDNIHELAALLLKKSALTRSFLSELSDDLPASEVNVEHLASVLRTAITSETQVTDSPLDIFISTRPNPPEGGSTTLGDLRKTIAAALASKNLLSFRTNDAFAWITEFPLFTLADEDKNQLSSLSSSTGSTTRWQSSHHPFTAPVSSDIPLITHSSLDPDSIAKVRGQHYDLVLNGQEIGGGSVRIHSRALQETVFRDVLKLDESERGRFAHLVHALDCGAPPHGGIALGFDRLMAILCNAESIRDVIAFPKQGSGTDPLFGSPAPLRGEEESQVAAEELLRMYGLSKAKASKEEK